MRIAKIISVLFVVLALSVNNLWATVIEINITAEITELYDPDGLLKGQLIVSDIITGSYIYDSATPDSSLEPDYGRYQHTSPPYGIYLSGGGFSFQTNPDNVDFVVVIEDGYSLIDDNYLIRSYNNLPLYDDVLVDTIEWHLHDSTGTALSGEALPTAAPVLEDWVSAGMHIDGGIPDETGKLIEYFNIWAPVTSVELVPEPATVFLLGLGGLALLKKRRA